jgi:hypothetical protein
MGITVSGSKPRANRRDKIIQRQISGMAIALRRRASMTTTTQEYHPGAVQVLGKAGSSSGYVIRDFLHRSDIPYEWVELHNDEEAHTKAGVSGLNDPPKGRITYILRPDIR